MPARGLRKGPRLGSRFSDIPSPPGGLPVHGLEFATSVGQQRVRKKQKDTRATGISEELSPAPSYVQESEKHAQGQKRARMRTVFLGLPD